MRTCSANKKLCTFTNLCRVNLDPLRLHSDLGCEQKTLQLRTSAPLKSRSVALACGHATRTTNLTLSHLYRVNRDSLRLHADTPCNTADPVAPDNHAVSVEIRCFRMRTCRVNSKPCIFIPLYRVNRDPLCLHAHMQCEQQTPHF